MDHAFDLIDIANFRLKKSIWFKVIEPISVDVLMQLDLELQDAENTIVVIDVLIESLIEHGI